MGGSSITVSMSDWSEADRIDLIKFVSQVEVKIAGKQPSPTLPAQPDNSEPSGWNKEAYQFVIKGLLNRHHVQVAVIFEAIKNGTGYVTRDKVYELGNYPSERSLKGFTRPVNRLTAEAVEANLLPDEDVEDLLAPDYDPNVTGFQRARGFFVPSEIVTMAQEWKL